MNCRAEALKKQSFGPRIIHHLKKRKIFCFAFACQSSSIILTPSVRGSSDSCMRCCVYTLSAFGHPFKCFPLVPTILSTWFNMQFKKCWYFELYSIRVKNQTLKINTSLPLILTLVFNTVHVFNIRVLKYNVFIWSTHLLHQPYL